MNVKIKALTAGVLFFMGGATVMAQKKDSAETRQIEEVVVLGYVKKTVTELTSSRLQLSGDKVNSPAAISIEQALQGKAPGVVVNASSGSPGASQNIRIRGVGSFGTNSEPLYVIDGVPILSGNFSGSANATSLTGMAAFNNLDIESITVLKDAAATAPYGARGSSGVIVITTKSGKKGKTQYEFNTSIGFQNDAYNKRNVLTGAQKKELLIEGVANQFNESLAAAETRIYANNYGNIKNWNGKEYNWTDLLTRKNAVIYNANISASGGKDKSRFFASLGYNNTDPTVIGPGFERVTGNLKFNQPFSDKIDFETSITGSWANQNAILEGGSFFSNPFITKYLMSPWANPYEADGVTPNISTFPQYTSIHNTLYTIKNNINRNKFIRALSNSKLDWKLYKNLTFTTRFNIDYSIADYKRYDNRLHGDGINTSGYAYRSKDEYYQWTLQNSLNYTVRFDKHKFDVTALFEYVKNQSDNLWGSGDTFPADGLTNIASAGANWKASSSLTDAKRVSYLGILGYNWNDRFILDATFRREGSSLFAPGLRYGNFWSVGGAYNLHKDILTNIFNELKVRASYGLTGNDRIARNSYQALLSYDGNYNGTGAAYPSVFGNPLLSWEKNNTLDVALDFGLLENRISGTVGYYNRKTFDLIQLVPLSRTTGFTSQNQNVGEMENKGIEAALNVDIIRGSDFNWSMSASVATVENKVLSLAKDGNGNNIDPSAGSVYTRYEVGQPMRFWYMQTWAGVDPATGAPLWYVNGVDGATTSNYNAAARVNQGTFIPKITGSLSTQLSYKNWSLSAQAYYAGGHKVYEQFAQFYLRTNNFTLVTYNGVDDLLNRWQKPGDITDIPKLSFSQNNFFHSTSSRHLYDGDFIRLKDVSLSYNLPSSYLKEIGINGLSFSVRGTNLYTWVKDKGLKLDPETGADGYTTLTTPPVKSIIFGVNVKF